MKVFSLKQFLKMADDIGIPREECELVFGLFEGLSKKDFFNLINSLEDDERLKDLADLGDLAEKAVVALGECFVEGEPTNTIDEVIEKVKSSEFKCKKLKDGYAISMSKRTHNGKCYDLKNYKNIMIVSHNRERIKMIGECGKDAGIKDKYGCDLRIGDIVMLFTNVKDDNKICDGFATCVIEVDGKVALMGCGESMNDLDEKFVGGWEIKKMLSVENMPEQFKYVFSNERNDTILVEYHNNTYSKSK